MSKENDQKISLDARYHQVHQRILSGPGKDLQESIDSGAAWKSGAATKEAMAALSDGAAVFPPDQKKTGYGYPIPGYADVEPGSTGSVDLAESKQKETQDGGEHSDA